MTFITVRSTIKCFAFNAPSLLAVFPFLNLGPPMAALFFRERININVQGR